MQLQLVPPHMHQRNAAEQAVRTLKKHVIYNLWTMYHKSPFYLWDRLLPQFTMTINMLRLSWLNPGLSSYEQGDGVQMF